MSNNGQKLACILYLLIYHNEPWDPWSAQGGQQDEEHGVVHHVQVEHYDRKVLRVFLIVSGPVGIPESS